MTGASGFVGRAIVKELSENNFETISLVNNSGGADDSPDGNRPMLFKADLRRAGSLENLAMPLKPQAVIHSAGLAHQFGKRGEADFREVNVGGTENTAEFAAARGAEHFILISSVAVYGRAACSNQNSVWQGADETAECRPEGIYAQTKLESEQVARRACERHKMRLTILRPVTVVGENDRGNVARLIEAIDKKRFLQIGDGSNRKSLIYKGDVARACVKVLGNTKRRNNTEVFNLTAEALPMAEIVAEICRRLGRREPRSTISPNLLEKIFRLNRATFNVERINGLAETVRKWLSEDVFSGEKFNRFYNFQPEMPVREAVGREVENYLRTK